MDLAWDPFDPHRLAVGKKLGTWFKGGSRGLNEGRGSPEVSGTAVMSLHFTGGEDARIRLWRVPPEGLQEMLTTPEAVLTGQLGPRWGLGDRW